jgi:hypothetical protein
VSLTAVQTNVQDRDGGQLVLKGYVFVERMGVTTRMLLAADDGVPE